MITRLQCAHRVRLLFVKMKYMTIQWIEVVFNNRLNYFFTHRISVNDIIN